VTGRSSGHFLLDAGALLRGGGDGHKDGFHWVLFPIKVSPGRHVLSVVSDTGVEMRKRFTVPETGRRYALIDYWRYADADSRHINWHIQSRPLHFM
jgi:hypothetical protein